MSRSQQRKPKHSCEMPNYEWSTVQCDSTFARYYVDVSFLSFGSFPTSNSQPILFSSLVGRLARDRAGRCLKCLLVIYFPVIHRISRVAKHLNPCCLHHIGPLKVNFATTYGCLLNFNLQQLLHLQITLSQSFDYFNRFYCFCSSSIYQSNENFQWYFEFQVGLFG